MNGRFRTEQTHSPLRHLDSDTGERMSWSKYHWNRENAGSRKLALIVLGTADSFAEGQTLHD